MADFQEIMDSGALTGGYLGGNAPENRIVTVADILTTIASMRLSAPIDIVLINDGTYVAVPFDTEVISANGTIVDVTAHTITVPKDGFYKVSFGFDGFYAGNDNVELMPHVNGAEYSSEPLAKSGEGNNDDIVVSWTSIVPLTANDVVDLRFRPRSDSSGNLNFRIKRLFFGIELIK